MDSTRSVKVVLENIESSTKIGKLTFEFSEEDFEKLLSCCQNVKIETDQPEVHQSEDY